MITTYIPGSTNTNKKDFVETDIRLNGVDIEDIGLDKDERMEVGRKIADIVAIVTAKERVL
jgi:hypothetical protein